MPLSVNLTETYYVCPLNQLILTILLLLFVSCVSQACACIRWNISDDMKLQGWADVWCSSADRLQLGQSFCSVIILTKFWPLQQLMELAADQTKPFSHCLCQKCIVNSRETCTNLATAMINGLITTLVAATVFASGQRCSSVPSAFCCILTGAVLRMLFRPADGWPMTDCHTHCIILAQG